MDIIDTSGIKVANSISDFNESEYKNFAMRTGDQWSFMIPPGELQNMDDFFPDHVLIVENINTSIGREIMCGKLVKKKN